MQFLAERHSDTESQTNEDSSDTNQTPPAPNYLETTIKTAGKHSTNTSFTTNGTQGQNGLDRNSPARDISAKQKNFSGSAKKNNNKKARHR